MKADVSGSTKTIQDEITEYVSTKESGTAKLLHRILDKLIGLKCPHCGESVNVTIESPE